MKTNSNWQSSGQTFREKMILLSIQENYNWHENMDYTVYGLRSTVYGLRSTVVWNMKHTCGVCTMTSWTCVKWREAWSMEWQKREVFFWILYILRLLTSSSLDRLLHNTLYRLMKWRMACEMWSICYLHDDSSYSLCNICNGIAHIQFYLCCFQAKLS